MSDWKIARKGRACGLCAREFEANEPFVSAIFLESGEGDDESAVFSRLDACPECFGKQARTPFSRWTTRIPPKEEKKPLLDLGLAKEFLLRLVREGDPAHAKVALVLTLLLLRKRRVKLVGESGTGEEKVMRILVAAEEGEVSARVPAPPVPPEEVAGITEELGRLFGLGGEDP
jgi:hypothetical protein